MSLTFERKHRSRRTINLTSLIDIIFLLVVFFMLTSKFVVSEIVDMSLSTIDSNASLAGDSDAVVISLLADNKFEIAGISYDISQLEGKLDYFLKDNKGLDIVIMSSQYNNVQDVMTTMDKIRRAGGYNISLSNG